MGFLISILLFIILPKILNQFVLHALPVGLMDFLVPGEIVLSLDSSSYLLSASGNLTLGFFEIPSTNFIYLGIWYTDSDKKIWVANRDKPIIGKGLLMMDDSGTLKVVNEGGTILFYVFNNQVGSHNNNTGAMLEDSGNFLVYDDVYDEDKRRVLWQSFDHLTTDILFPGMKIGYNLTTKQNWTLTSWLSDQVPASGAFTMRLEQYQNSPQLLIYRRGELYWASGPWKNGTFRFLDSFLATLDPPPHYYLNLVFDASGMYITIQTTASILRLTPDGQVIGNNPSNIDTKFCYRYERDDGCAVFAVPNCRGQNDSFQLMSGNWLSGPQNIDNNSSISLGDCMERCWNDCNCLGFITNSNGTGCRTWVKQKHMHFEEDFSHKIQEKYVLVSQKTPKTKTRMWIVVCLAIVLTSVLAAYMCYVWIRRSILAEEEKRRDDFIHQLAGSNSIDFGDELEKGIKDAPDINIFSLKAILDATDNFSNENKLGEGGFGPVYMGKLFDGREIAVKRLSKTSGQGIEEFKNELILISKLRHTNLVRLYGCCIHREEKMLIYEFMPNKSLDFFLFVEDKKENINWGIRFNIIEGVAQGLLYLHKYSRMIVIHRDLKASNVLLDENMNPKIADFGMARIFQKNVTEAMTKRVVGTYGYMAPEYAMQGTFSIKSDVFSFGVLILEIVNGNNNSSFYKFDVPHNLVGYAWELWKREAALEFRDEALGESYDVNQLLRAIHVGLLCVQENANDRPIMSEVVYMLNNEIGDLPIPKQPAFFIHPDEVQPSRSTKHLLGNNIQGSINGLTITTMEAR